MPEIVLTGGGTAGHVTPNIALLPKLIKEGYNISYIGSLSGIERQLIEKQGIPYYGIPTGKLRRYLSLQNLTDPFRVVKGFFEARAALAKIRPSVVFSKGGFVSVPVVWAANTLGIPCIIHESDMTPGLANKLCIPMAKKICCNFPETLDTLPKGKAVLTGSPVRKLLLEGSRERGYEFCGFADKDKPVILAMGGSLGAAAINSIIRTSLPSLLEKYYVVHLCGRDKVDNLLLNTEGYKQFEYINDEMGDILAMADVIVSRAGANAICEFQALCKPSVLIPLPLKSSRGDQIKNAESFERRGFALTIDEDYLSRELLLEKIGEVFEKRELLTANMKKSLQDKGDSIGMIIDLIKECGL